MIKVTLSICDSRNLNLSPFCNLSSTSVAMWQPSVLETYGDLTTTYINETTGPLRLNYPNSMGDRELISSLTKVWSKTHLKSEQTLKYIQGQVYYNAYKEDMAIVNIFFGETTVYGQ